MDIYLHNSRTRRKERFEPIDEKAIRLYLCGPTVYDRSHIGNARNVVMFDVLVRLLRHVYGPKAVHYARNFTDVDDKINANYQATGRPIEEITDETIGWYIEDMTAIGTLPPDHMPRATEYIDQIISMITTLIDKGHAYAAEGHVLFAVQSYAEYGALSGRSVEDMIAGARVEVAPYKRDPMDFVLWKPSDPDLPGWESPWGRGRPGWHIECSAMISGLFGAEIDIHGGGSDLLFPHHENEMAQSCCAHPERGFARFWLHNEMLNVEGRKMSKSLGNFFTIRDLLDQGIAPEVMRFVLLATHYGRPLDWTQKRVEEAEKVLRRFGAATDGVEADGTVPASVLAMLADDLNTAGAIAELHQLYQSGAYGALKAGAQFLGLLTPEMGAWRRNDDAGLAAHAEHLAQLREEAMASKDFSKLDAAKARLLEAGFQVRMGKDGVELIPPMGFDLSTLEMPEP